MTVFGPTNEIATGPLGASAGIVREPVECAPCLLRECPIDHRCMTRVTAEHVVRAAEEARRARIGGSAPVLDYGLPKEVRSILIVRLGAMGDLIHALPGAASLKHSFPEARITWVVEPRWVPLLEGNGFVDRIVVFRRDEPRSWRRTKDELRAERYDLAVDFQGLVKSALIAHVARPERIAGFGSSVIRELPAGLFYSTRVQSGAQHVVDQALDLAAGAGASNLVRAFPLPAGAPEGTLPTGRLRWRVLWPAGLPNSGRSNITHDWRKCCARSSACRWC